MEIEIVKFDNLGRGIGYINNKIIFVPKSVPGDLVKVEVVLNKKDYLEGKIIEILKPAKIREVAKCPYFDFCGGCDLMHISLSNMLDYKLDKINSIFKSNDINYHVSKIIKSNNPFNYRNKVSFKIVDKKIGFYENNTHTLVSIQNCLLCKEEINNILKDINILGIENGNITIRCNSKNELLLIIDTKDSLNNFDYLVNNYKIAGIILNDKCIYGEDFFIENIDNSLFKISYNSFFQVNNYICSKLFQLIKNYTEESSNILDFYCGVGTLGIVASNNDKNVLGVEIIENAIKDAFINKCLNKKDNMNFLCADTKNATQKITNKFDTIILDPPRSGVDKNVLTKIIKEKISKIIYVSCNPITLARDLKELDSNYEIKEVTLLDMFPNTEHVECICFLEKKIKI